MLHMVFIGEMIITISIHILSQMEEYQAKQKEVEGVCNPIITKLYGASGGGAPGGPDMGGMGGGAPPGAGAAGGQGGAGPTIEEVD